MKLAELLRSRRQALGMSLEDVADATGSSKSYVWELENGKSYKMGLTLAARFAVKALSICTVSDDLLRHEFMSADDRQSSLKDMIALALDVATA